jgi:RHS repeat-associated protein
MTYDYDSLGRLTGRSHTVGTTSPYEHALSYDNDGRIVGKTETIGGETHTYTYSYDEDGQLRQVRRNGVTVEQYSYDVNGNRVSNMGETATYDVQDRLTNLGGISYVFNEDGYLTTRDSDTFTYSTMGALLQATVGGSTVTYSSDALGRRVSRSDSSGVYQYLYGNLGKPFQITASRDPSGVFTFYYYDEAGFLFAFERGGSRYYVATDQVGSPRVVTDSTGNVIKVVEYTSFGEILTDTNPGFDLSIGFAGGLYDPLTGLVRFGFRDYDPAAGRWTARDPILFKGSPFNVYVYVGNNPVTLIDPSGAAFTFGGSAYGGIGGGVQISIGSDGITFCSEIGIGVGAGIDLDLVSDRPPNGTSFVAEASATIGGLGSGVGFQVDDEGHITISASGDAFGVGLQRNWTFDDCGWRTRLGPRAKIGLGEITDPAIQRAIRRVAPNLKPKLQGKLAAQACFGIPM